jgi:hypothetical protein
MWQSQARGCRPIRADLTIHLLDDLLLRGGSWVFHVTSREGTVRERRPINPCDVRFPRVMGQPLSCHARLNPRRSSLSSLASQPALFAVLLPRGHFQPTITMMVIPRICSRHDRLAWCSFTKPPASSLCKQSVPRASIAGSRACPADSVHHGVRDPQCVPFGLSSRSPPPQQFDTGSHPH